MNAVEEIVEHHRYIEAWLRGTAPTSGLAAFLDMHTADFTLCGPDGSLTDWAGLGPLMEGIHATAPDVHVEIRDPRLLLDETGIVVATYEEHQPTAESSSARRALAMFVPDPRKRHGLRWRHLYETWITPPRTDPTYQA